MVLQKKIKRRLFIDFQGNYDNNSPPFLPIYVLLYGLKDNTNHDIDISIYLRRFKNKYPEDLINRTVKNFVDSFQSDAQKPPQVQYQGKTVRIVLPYKDQKSANVLRRRLKDLSVKIGNATEIVPVFINRKIESHLKHRENMANVVK